MKEYDIQDGAGVSLGLTFTIAHSKHVIGSVTGHADGGQTAIREPDQEIVYVLSDSHHLYGSVREKIAVIC